MRTDAGFTLIELLIAIGIVVVVSVVGFLGLSGYRGSQNLKLVMNELVAVIRDTQKRSITQEDGKQWGLRFINSTSTTHSYEAFSGPTYASGTVNQVHALRRGIELGNPGDGLNIDAIFSAISGKLSENKVISLVTKRGSNLVGDVILGSLGLVTTRLETGVVGYWHFDEGSGTTVYDTTGNGNAGTLTNGPTWQSSSNCKAGTCLSFDGTDDFVNVPNSSSLDFSGTDKLSVAAWVNLNTDASSSVQHWIATQGNSHQFLIGNSNFDIRFTIRNSTSYQGVTSGGPTLTLGVWNHLVGTYDGTNVKLYVNGALTNTVAVTGTILSGGADEIIGATDANGANSFYGKIDEIRIYSRMLTATGVSNHYDDLK